MVDHEIQWYINLKINSSLSVSWTLHWRALNSNLCCFFSVILHMLVWSASARYAILFFCYNFAIVFTSLSCSFLQFCTLFKPQKQNKETGLCTRWNANVQVLVSNSNLVITHWDVFFQICYLYHHCISLTAQKQMTILEARFIYKNSR